MDKKSVKVKIFLNLFGTYKEVRQVADITTAIITKSNWTKNQSKLKNQNYTVINKISGIAN